METKNAKEIGDLRKLRKLFAAMFWLSLSFVVFVLAGFAAVVALAVALGNLDNNAPLLYSAIAYVVSIVVFLGVYFLIGQKANRHLNDNPTCLVLYGNREIFKNPLGLMKEMKTLKRAIADLAAGFSVSEVKERRFGGGRPE